MSPDQVITTILSTEDALSAVRAFALFVGREIRPVVIDKRNMILLLQRERHTAAGAAEAEIVLIRLDAGFNDCDKSVLVRHIRDCETFIDADAALTGLLFQLPIEIKSEAGVYWIVTMPLHRAAHAGRHGNIRRVADYIFRYLDGHDHRICVKNFVPIPCNLFVQTVSIITDS